jgi:hypothetical protein
VLKTLERSLLLRARPPCVGSAYGRQTHSTGSADDFKQTGLLLPKLARMILSKMISELRLGKPEGKVIRSGSGCAHQKSLRHRELAAQRSM